MGKVLKVREVEDPILSIKCKEVDVKNINQEIMENIEDLKETLNFTEGFGIAASQAGINKRIIIIQVDKEKCTYKDCEEVPTTVMINPTWRKDCKKSKRIYSKRLCLSISKYCISRKKLVYRI